MKLVYRMHTKDDEAALIRLWSEHGGWDQVDAETWAHRLLRPPLGEAAIALAVDADSDEILAQFAFIPSLISVNGREVSALRPFAPVFATAARRRSLVTSVHPVLKLYWHAVGALRARGDGLIYMVPDPRWVRFLRLLPYMQCGSFPLWSLPVPLVAPLSLGSGYAVASLPTWDERVDRLWDSASRLHQCLVVRDARTLPWKLSHGDYTVTAIERGGELVGLVASCQKGDRQWLVCDLLAADDGDSLRATLTAAVNIGHAEAVAAEPERPIRKVAILATPVLEPVLRDLGFTRDAYDFPLMIHILNPALPKQDVAPERWYLSAND
ncbi:MAG: hypothetical protein ACR2MB_15180 [Acidimicrobiales bacterium]